RIAERFQYEMVVALYGELMGNVKMVGLPVSRHHGRMHGKGTTGRKQVDLSSEKWIMAHSYVLHNEDEVRPYIQRYMNFLRTNRRASEKSIANEHNQTVFTWFKEQVMRELLVSPQTVSDRLKSLAYGPNFNASFYSGFVINGCTFYTKDQDAISTMYANSGVTLETEVMHFSSVKDKNPVYCKMRYYCVIEEICELHYNEFSVPLFGCKWVDNSAGVSFDDLIGCVVVNLDKQGHKEDPFILTRQSKQVFYMTDPSDKRRLVVITPPSCYDIIDDGDEDEDEDEDIDGDDDDDDDMLEEGYTIKKVQFENNDICNSSNYVRIAMMKVCGLIRILIRGTHGIVAAIKHDDLGMRMTTVISVLLMTKKKKHVGKVVDGATAEDDTSNVEQAHRAEERGRTVLTIVGKAIQNETEIPVDWHTRYGVPTGDRKIGDRKVRTILSSYIGVVARERVNINYLKWGDVP
ncbi:hypothetical protein SOVF_062060, partial [Spinacia oleracea]